MADTAYGADEDAETCPEAGIVLISPVAEKAPTAGPGAAGAESPMVNEPDNSAGGTSPASPDKAKSRKERLEGHRTAQQTEVWKRDYAKRSGQEGMSRALDRVTGIKQLVTGGSKAVGMSLYLKTIGWNIIKSGRAYVRRGIAARKMEPQAG